MTAAASAPAVAATEAPGAVLGRYWIERELGAGAIGAVHAAFDPDLERRIALKVLRRAAASREARERLLREARAMARLAHPNVVTVYEVGTAGERDFIAMELIHGETLADWLRASPRSPAAILDAFLAAGRGLAAAHAAGIVHRDFKPRNVLRSRDGRIAVTDFGLARETDGELSPALEDLLPIGSVSRARSERPELTVTGALLGTPAYMAPEQWRGDAITPRTDQFAYCVALWEALSSERPYRGPSVDELRRQIAEGPMALDASRIPRRLRGLLCRGLDPDPARRWPSMEALLGRLVRVQRRPGAALAIAGGALTAAAALVLALRGRDAPVALCDLPAHDVASVWSPAVRADFATKTSDAHVAMLDMAYWSWRAARGAACAAPPQVRPAQLACLDGVLGRFDALRQAFAQVPAAAAEELQAQLIDPEVCRAPVADQVPQLTLAPNHEVIAAYVLLALSATTAPPPRAELAGLADAVRGDPCARGIATLAVDAVSSMDEARDLTADLDSAADQCDDERLRAEFRIEQSRFQWERGEAATENARNVAARVMQPELHAALAMREIEMARARGRLDRAFRWADAAVADYRARGLELRQLRAVIVRNDLRQVRSEPHDLEAIAGDVERWRPLAAAHHRPDLASQLDAQGARARFWRGDVAGAHDALRRLLAAKPGNAGGSPRITANAGGSRRLTARAGASVRLTAKAGVSRRITGEVVDDRGRPVVGARVAAASGLFADTVEVGVPALVVASYFIDDLRIATSDAGGRFAIEDGASIGAIVAQQGDRRSPPVRIADHVRLVLEPTRTVTGVVELAGHAHTHVRIQCNAIDAPVGTLDTIAPVAADGSFVVRGASVRALQIIAIDHNDSALDRNNPEARVATRTVPASPDAAEVRIDLTARPRTIDVIVRSASATQFGGVLVMVFAGKHRITSLEHISRLPRLESAFARPASETDVPEGVRDRIHSGDLVAHIAYSGHAELTVCAVDASGGGSNTGVARRGPAQQSLQSFACEQVGPDATVAELRLPAQ